MAGRAGKGSPPSGGRDVMPNRGVATHPLAWGRKRGVNTRREFPILTPLSLPHARGW